MKIRLFFAFMIFMSSYLPLSIILLVKNFKNSSLQQPLCIDLKGLNNCELPFNAPFFTIGMTIFCFVSLILLIITMKLVRPTQKIKILAAKHVPSDIMNYSLPYVVSFMGINYQEPKDFVGFLIFIFWMFWVSNATGVIMLNPILSIMKWKLYEVDFSYVEGKVRFSSQVLSKSNLESNLEIKSIQIQEVMFVS